MAGYGYGISVSGSRTPIVVSSTPAPSGIPVASTASVVMANFNPNNGTYTKSVEGTDFGSDPSFSLGVGVVFYKPSVNGTGQTILLPPTREITVRNSYEFEDYYSYVTAEAYWRIVDVTAFESETSINTLASNSSTDASLIPTTGWSPAITITAVPSGINANQVGDLIIDFGYFPDATYSKLSNTSWEFGFSGNEVQTLTWNSVIANTWVLDVNNGEKRATNPSTDSQFIPTTGWVYTIGDGFAVTITAA